MYTHKTSAIEIDITKDAATYIEERIREKNLSISLVGKT